MRRIHLYCYPEKKSHQVTDVLAATIGNSKREKGRKYRKKENQQRPRQKGTSCDVPFSFRLSYS